MHEATELIVDEYVAQELKNVKDDDKDYSRMPWTWWPVPVTYEFKPYAENRLFFRYTRNIAMFLMIVYLTFQFRNYFHDAIVASALRYSNALIQKQHQTRRCKDDFAQHENHKDPTGRTRGAS